MSKKTIISLKTRNLTKCASFLLGLFTAAFMVLSVMIAYDKLWIGLLADLIVFLFGITLLLLIYFRNYATVSKNRIIKFVWFKKQKEIFWKEVTDIRIEERLNKKRIVIESAEGCKMYIPYDKKALKYISRFCSDKTTAENIALRENVSEDLTEV